MKKLIHILNKKLFNRISINLPLPFSKWLYSFVNIYKDYRSIYFDKAFQKLNQEKISRDYLEFDFYAGTSFILAYKTAKKYGINNLRFFAIDSFEGLPDSEGNVL